MTHANIRSTWGRKGADDAESGLIVWAGLERTVVWCGVVWCGQRMNVSGVEKEGDEGMRIPEMRDFGQRDEPGGRLEK